MHSEDDLGTSDSDDDRSVSELTATAPQAVVGSKRKRIVAAANPADTFDSSEDEKQANDALAGGRKAVLQAETAAHKAQLQALKEQDPEFFAYLQVRSGPALTLGMVR